MNEYSAVHLVALIGWLILCCSAMGSYKLGWRKGLTIALVWVAIFGGLFLVFSLFTGE